MPDVELTRLANDIRSRVDSVLRGGETPQIILDLDGTLFDNVPRTKQILADEAKSLYGEDSDVTRRIENASRATFEYSPIDTMRKHGIQDESVLEKLRERWGDHFFTSSYLKHDEPVPGALDAVLSWWRSGAEINYLTGRHVPEMYLGTSRSLFEAGFPLGTVRTHLLMKPVVDMIDVPFKVDTIPSIRKKGPIVLVVDNDPRILNPLYEVASEAIFVMLESQHPSDAPELLPGIPRVSDFRALA